MGGPAESWRAHEAKEGGMSVATLGSVPLSEFTLHVKARKHSTERYVFLVHGCLVRDPTRTCMALHGAL